MPILALALLASTTQVRAKPSNTINGEFQSKGDLVKDILTRSGKGLPINNLVIEPDIEDIEKELADIISSQTQQIQELLSSAETSLGAHSHSRDPDPELHNLFFSIS